MKKTIFALIISIIGLVGIQKDVKAQVFNKGNLLFDMGIGIPFYSYSSIPPVYVNIEAGVHEYIGVGATAGYYSWSTYWLFTNYRYYANYFVGGGFVTFHGSELLKQLDLDMDDLLNTLDLYAKAGFAMKFKNYNDYRWNSNISDYVEVKKFGVYPDINFNLGARYYLSSNLAIFMEIGTGFYSYVQGGITLKLK